MVLSGQPTFEPFRDMHIDTTLPGGNAAILAVRADEAPPEVHFAASPGEGPEAVWFHVAIEPGASRPARIRAVLHGFENLLGNTTGANTEGLHPVYRTDRSDWRRIERVERIETPDGRVLAAWSVPGDEGRVELALSFPYGPAQLDVLLQDVADVFERVPIGVTSADAWIMRLSNDPGVRGGDRPGIYCLARQHAAEAPGSWVLDGFLRRMAREGAAAPLVWAVPFADLDGVAAGRAGKDRFPWDFNRAWGSKRFPKELHSSMGTHPMRHEVKAIQHDLLRWRERCRPCLVLDFHAPVVCQHGGVYAYLRDVDAEGHPDAAHAPWVAAFRETLDPDLTDSHFVRVGRYPSRWSTARVGDFATQALNVPQVTFETPYGCARSRIYARDDYQTVGSQIAEAVLQTLARDKDAP